MVRVLPYASITTRQLGKELTDFAALKKAGAFAFTDDGVGIQAAGMMLAAMKEAAALDMAVVAIVKTTPSLTVELFMRLLLS